ncbi:ATP-binding cassette domain-containing protein [Helicobacter cetorum]|uniref:Molybdenum ABC transporter ATP-binding protein (ModD) n=1 Tax=Helicobacter cetorum (strain ATCC BAA-429 / MIT 00-7128) TaxID=182217 RepID=I0END3_HELC0|nr:sulfate/molybdate ABC transporter ATP-binding protein [Helicobacter cetorum]AFI04452.1 molybdenum ABC transporter ATP-binding protein (modD) [Helicobacter cetorum MIT 00-7128]
MIKARFKKPLLGARGKFVLDIDLEIEEKEIVALCGESGAGKSTILRVLAGLERVDEGYIEVNHSIWLDTQKKIFLKPQNRKIGFVFQDYALFPHLNVYQNIAFANPKDKNKINEVLHLMRLENLSKQKISQLSGGQAQRVALARALIGAKNLLLLDEPLNALDNALKTEIELGLLEFIKRENLSVILVSHNLSEITKLAQTFLFLNKGILNANQKSLPFSNRLLAKPLFEDENCYHYKILSQTITLPKDCLNPTFKLEFK